MSNHRQEHRWRSAQRQNREINTSAPYFPRSKRSECNFPGRNETNPFASTAFLFTPNVLSFYNHRHRQTCRNSNLSPPSSLLFNPNNDTIPIYSTMPPRPRRNSAPQNSSPADAPLEEITPVTPQAAPLDCTIRIRPSGPREDPSATQPAELPGQPSASGTLSTPAVTYGHFNDRDPMFYFRATVSQLKSFIASAPEHLRPRLPASATKDTLLEEIFRLREEENGTSTDPHQARQALSKLLSMNPADITRLASTNATELKSLMSSALAADAALEPHDLGDCEPNHLGMIVLAWQLDALKQARAIIDQPPPTEPHVTFNLEDQSPQHTRLNPPPVSATARDNLQINARQQSRIEPILNPTPSSRQPRDVNALSTLLHPADAHPISRARESQQQLSDSSEDDIPQSRRKKRKSAISPTFSYGIQASQANLMRTYPGKGVSSSSLHIDNLWGPSVLCSMTAGGMDIPTFLAQFQHWKRLANVSPSHDEIEVHTIGRAIHVEMLDCFGVV